MTIGVYERCLGAATKNAVAVLRFGTENDKLKGCCVQTNPPTPVTVTLLVAVTFFEG